MSISLIIFNIVINSLLAFVTAFFLIEGVIRLFRIKNPRCLAFFRMIPILKMPIDLLRINLGNWALAHDVFPWECPEGTRLLTIGFGMISSWSDLVSFPFSLQIRFCVADHLSFSLADVLAYKIGPVAVSWIAVAIIGVTTYKLALFFLGIISTLQKKKSLLHRAVPCLRPVRDPFLTKHCILAQTEEPLNSPCVIYAYPPVILFARPFLAQLNQDEYEAIIAHEQKHIRHWDAPIRLLLRAITALFWWLPTNRLIRSIEFCQEVAADRVQRPLAIASALVKTARFRGTQSTPCGIPFVKRSMLRQRIHALVNSQPNTFTSIQKIILGFTYLIAAMILLGKLWGL